MAATFSERDCPAVAADRPAPRSVAAARSAASASSGALPPPTPPSLATSAVASATPDTHTPQAPPGGPPGGTPAGPLSCFPPGVRHPYTRALGMLLAMALPPTIVVQMLDVVYDAEGRVGDEAAAPAAVWHLLGNVLVALLGAAPCVVIWSRAATAVACAAILAHSGHFAWAGACLQAWHGWSNWEPALRTSAHFGALSAFATLLALAAASEARGGRGDSRVRGYVPKQRSWEGRPRS